MVDNSINKYKKNNNMKKSLDNKLDDSKKNTSFIESCSIKNDKLKLEKKKILINDIEKEYIEVTKINNEITNISDPNSLDKNLVRKQKKLYKSLYKKIKKCESIVTNDKYSELDGDLVILLENVNKYYTSPTLTTKVLSNVNLEINKGDFVVILGPSGSGKTSLMNLLSGIDKISYGSLNVAGFKLANLSKRQLTGFRKEIIGYVFQRYGLLPNLTVYENILMGSFLGKNTISNKSYEIDDNYKNSFHGLKESEKILKIIEIMGLLEQKEKYPYEMSGGQKQRTSIARTMAKNPLIVFGDEPTGAVDVEMSNTIIQSFVKVNKELQNTIIIITHDEKISQYANKVVFVLDGKIDNVVHKKKGVKL